MRHDFDVASLLLGLVFAAAAVAGLNGWFRDVLASPELWEPEVVVAIALVALGLLLGSLIAILLGRRRRRELQRPADGHTMSSGADGDRPGVADRPQDDPANEATHADA